MTAATAVLLLLLAWLPLPVRAASLPAQEAEHGMVVSAQHLAT
jgi:hypothetical protein